jgi:hypothetical protein
MLFNKSLNSIWMNTPLVWMLTRSHWLLRIWVKPCFWRGIHNELWQMFKNFAFTKWDFNAGFLCLGVPDIAVHFKCSDNSAQFSCSFFKRVKCLYTRFTIIPREIDIRGMIHIIEHIMELCIRFQSLDES